jgi:putative nucleotidyltransferase with HDIG domain
MQKCIPIADLRLGMYIRTFGGSWMSHPFWRENFILDSQSDLSRIRASGVKEVWIDSSKGRDVDAPEVAEAETPTVDVAPPVPESVSRQVPRVAFDEELSRAQTICARSKAAITEMFSDVRMGYAIEHEHVSGLVEEISSSVSRNPDAFISLARLKNADEYTYMHSVAVCALMIALARQLSMTEPQVKEAGVAGLLHDIGKMAIPDAILNKPGRLTDAEFNTVREHPVAGKKMLTGVGVSSYVIDVCTHHHEKIDGSGYPEGLRGDEISLFARMAAICDVYDAVTSSRCYKARWEPADAIRKMAEWKGHFDEHIFQAFVRTVGIYPVGALVRLDSGRLGVVTEQNKKSLLQPKVKVFLSVRTKQPIMHEVIDLSKYVGIDKIVACESPHAWGVNNVDALWLGSAIGVKQTQAHI